MRAASSWSSHTVQITASFADLDEARHWAARFVAWYNHEHLHSGLRFVPPAERHARRDASLLSARVNVYEAARQRHPRRWSRATRNWTPIGAVMLNPERDCLAAMQPNSRRHCNKRLAA